MKKALSLTFVIAMTLIFSTYARLACAAESTPGAPSKIINIAISENPVTLNPLDQANVPGTVQATMCYEPLIQYTDKGEYVPKLAKSWQISEDGKEIVFKLQEGVKFHNGEEFDADDCVATFRYIMDHPGQIHSNVTFWGDKVTGFEAVDKYTFRLVLSHPYGALLPALMATYIIPGDALAKYGDKLWHEQMMYGTGPWVFDKWLDGQYSHYTKNKDYWDKANYDSYYDEVYIRFLNEKSSAVASHLAGDVQAYVTPGGIDSDMERLYKGTENRIVLDKQSSGSFSYIGFSFKEGSPFNDIKVRKAFDYAIDRRALVDDVLGAGKVPNGIIVDTCIGYNPDIPPFVYDPEEAKRLLAESTYKGEPIVLTANTSHIKGESILLAVSENLNDVGFKTSIRVVEVAALADMRKTGNYDAFMVANMHATGDPVQTINMRILNDAHHSFYKNEALFDLIRKSNYEPDSVKRDKLLQEIGAMMAEEHAPHSALLQMELTYALDKGVSGLYLYPDGTLRFCYVDYRP